MDFIDRLREISKRIPVQQEHITTEEATKNAFVMPFIQALGYNVFDPTEVVPEFTADVGTKKGEKVDYAIMGEGHPIMLFECKWCGANLGDSHHSQLFRYFSVTKARVAVLTNGITFKFYSDLEEANKMDRRPFLEFDMLEFDDALVGELKRLTKDKFDIDELVSAAGELKYTRQIKKVLAEQLSSPSEEIVRFLASQVYDGRMTQPVKEQFTEITKSAFRQFINDQLNARLKSALGQGSPKVERIEADSDEEDPATETEPCKSDSDIVTTQEEIDGFNVVRAILCGMVDVERVAMRDTKSYCGILLDDNNRKPICRLRFNATSVKYLGFLDREKNEEKVAIDKVEDIYKHADRLRETVGFYESA